MHCENAWRRCVAGMTRFCTGSTDDALVGICLPSATGAGVVSPNSASVRRRNGFEDQPGRDVRLGDEGGM